MGILSWMRRWFAKRKSEPRSTFLPGNSGDLVPNLYIRQLEERRVLNGMPLAGQDDVRELFVSAGPEANDGQADTFYVARRGDEVEVSVNGEVWQSANVANVDALSIGGSGDDDTLVVDLSGGDPTDGGTIRFDGGGGGATGGDRLVIQGAPVGAQVDTLTHRFEGIGEGFINAEYQDADSAPAETQVLFVGIEKISEEVTTGELHFEFAAEPGLIEIADVAGKDGFSQITGAGVQVEFANPTESLTVNTDGEATSQHGSPGTDEVRLVGLDQGFSADLFFEGDSADRVSISGQLDLNRGDLDVRAGDISVPGEIRSDGASVQLDSGETGTTVVSGSVDVSDTAEAGTGGSVHLLGHHVEVSGDARVDASGYSAGGTVLIGGDFQGSNAAVRNAAFTFVGSEVRIAADALAVGDGGEAIVWADDTTRFYGDISARGGPTSGNGGFVETSGKRSLTFRGTVDVSAPRGRGGWLLLDPNNITVEDGGATTLFDAGDNSPQDNTLSLAEGGGTGTDQSIDASAINTVLATGATVVLQAHTDIIINEAIDGTGGTAGGGLTLRAGDDIFVNQNITTDGGAITMVASDPGGTPTGVNADGTGDLSVAVGVTVGTGGQDLLIAADDVVLAATSLLDAGTGNVTLMPRADATTIGIGDGSAGDFQLDAAELTTNLASSGTVTIGRATGSGDISVQALGMGGESYDLKIRSDIGSTINFRGNVTVGGNSLAVDPPDTINVDAELSATGNGAISLEANRNIVMSTGAKITSVDGDITLRANAEGDANGPSVGIDMSGAEISSTGGDISLTAHGGDGGSESVGIRLEDSSLIESSGAGLDAGAITLDGTGGDGTSHNHGTAIQSDSTVTSVDGDIHVIGSGGGDGTGQRNFGVYMGVDGVVASTGTGADAAEITIDGTGGSGTIYQTGVHLYSSIIRSEIGDIEILGQGGNGSQDGRGILLAQGALIDSTGAGAGAATISLTGTGGTGSTRNHGVDLHDAGTMIRSQGGAITLDGTGGGASGLGVNLDGGAEVEANGGASMAFDGRGAGTNRGIKIDAAISGGVGEIAFTADKVLFGTSSAVSGSGDLVIQPEATTTSIGVGAGSSGTLFLPSNQLSHLIDGFQRITIGRGDGAHDIDVGTASFADAVSLRAPSGGNITVGAIVGTDTIWINAGSGTILDDADDTITDITAGGLIRLTAGGNIGATGADVWLDLAANSLVEAQATGGGGISLRSDGAVTLQDVSTANNSIDVTAAGQITADDVAAAGNGDVRLATTAGGDILVNTISATGNKVELEAAGSVVDNKTSAAADITADKVLLQAGDAVGDATDAIETTVSNLAAAAGTGGVFVDNTGGLTIGGADLAVLGISAADGIQVMASSPIFVNEAVLDDGGGDIRITAAGSTTNDDLTVAADITATGGDGAIFLQAGDDILHTAGTVQTSGGGGIDYDAKTSGTTTGKVTMSVGAQVITPSGDIELHADGDIIVTVIASTSGTVFVTSDSGAIVDGNLGNDNITAPAAVLVAATGVGESGDPLETAVGNLEAVGGTGGVHVVNTGALTIGGIGATEGISSTGGDINVTANSPLTVTENIIDDSGGHITLTAASDTLAINAIVAASGGHGDIVLNGDTLIVTDPAADTDPDISVEGNGTITANVAGTTTLSFDVQLATADRAITLNTDDLVIDEATAVALAAGAGAVAIRATTANRRINLGTETALDFTDLDLSEEELNRIEAARLIVGRGNNPVAGDVEIVGSISSSADLLHIITVGSVTGAGSISAAHLAVEAGAGVTLSNPANEVTNLAVDVVAGVIEFVDATGLRIGSVDGVTGLTTAANGSIDVQTVDGILEVAESVSADGSGNVTLIAGDVAGDLRIDADISTGGGDIHLAAGQNIKATGGTVTGDDVFLRALGGVGEAGLPILTSADQLGVLAGDVVFVEETDDVTVGSVRNLVDLDTFEGIATTDDNVQLTLAGIGAKLTVANVTTGTDTIRLGDARLTVRADEMAIETDGGADSAITATAVILRSNADQSILLGAANSLTADGTLEIDNTELAEIVATDLVIGGGGTTTQDISLGGDTVVPNVTNVLLQASGAIDGGAADRALNVKSGTGNLALRAAGDIGATNVFHTEVDVLSAGALGATVRLAETAAGGHLALGTVTVDETDYQNVTSGGDVSIATTGGNLALDGGDGGGILSGPAGTVTLTSNAWILDGGTLGARDVTARELVVDGATAVGATGSLETAVDFIDIEATGSGGVGIGEIDDVTVTLIDGSNGAVFVVAGGNVTIDRIVTDNGGANAVWIQSGGEIIDGSDAAIDIEATGATARVRLAAVNGIGVTGARNALDTAASGFDVSNSGAAGVAIENELDTDVTIDRMSTVYDNNGAGWAIDFVQAGDGSLTVSPTGVVSSGDGATAGGDIQLASDGAMTVAGTISSQSGSGGAVEAGGVAIESTAVVQTGKGDIRIGGGSPDTIIGADLSSGASLDLSAVRDVIVAAEVSTTNGASITIEADSNDTIGTAEVGTGGVQIEAGGQVAAAGDVTIRGADLFVTDGAGVIDSILIDPDGTNNQIQAGGSVTLEHKGAAISHDDAGIFINGLVDAGTAIDVTAKKDIEFGAAGGLSSAGGPVTVIADDRADDGGGAISMADGALVDAGGGVLTFNADGSIRLGGLKTTNATGAAVQISSAAGEIIDAGDTHTDIEAAGTATLGAPTGIGQTGAFGAVDTSIGTLIADSDTGGMAFQEADTLSIGPLQTTVNGNVAIGVTAGDVTTTGSIATVGGGVSVSAAAGGVTIDHAVTVAGGPSGGVSITAAGANNGVTVNAAMDADDGNVDITTGAGGTLAFGSAGSVATAGAGKITLRLDKLEIDPTANISAEDGDITVREVTPGRDIDLGAADPATDGVEISQAEIDTFSFGPAGLGVLVVGSAGSGDISLSDVITAPVNVLTMRIEGTGNVTSTAAANEIAVSEIAVEVTGSIGSAGTRLGLNAGQFAARSTVAGDIFLQSRQNGASIASVNGVAGLTTANGDIDVLAPVDLNVDATVQTGTGGNITLTTTSGGILNVNAGVIADAAGAVGIRSDGGFTLADGITVASTEGDLTVETTGAGAVLVVNGSVVTGGVGTIDLTGAHAISMDGDSLIQTASGAILLDSAAGGISVDEVESTNNGQVTIAAGTGGITEVDDTARVGAAGGSSTVVLTAGTTVGGVGTGSALNADAGVLRLTAGGQADVREVSGIQLGDAAGGVTSSGGNITITTVAGSITTGNSVTTTGGNGNIVLTSGGANGVTLDHDVAADGSGFVDVNSGAGFTLGDGVGLSSHTGDITADTAGANPLLVNGAIATGGSGTVTLTGSDAITMDATSLVQTVSGAIIFDSNAGGVAVDVVESTGDAQISITATGAGITEADDSARVGAVGSASTLVLTAGTKINGTGTRNALNTDVAVVRGSADGNFVLLEADDVQLGDGTGGVTLAGGHVSVATVDGSITVDNSLTTGGTGSIVLTARSEDADIVVNHRLATVDGPVNLAADDGVRFSANGDIEAGGSTAVTVTANENPVAGDDLGAITMADGSLIDGGSGQIHLFNEGAGAGDITLGGLITTNALAQSVRIRAEGAVVDGGIAQEDVVSAGELFVIAKTGVGTVADPLEVSVASLNIQNTGDDPTPLPGSPTHAIGIDSSRAGTVVINQLRTNGSTIKMNHVGGTLEIDGLVRSGAAGIPGAHIDIQADNEFIIREFSTIDTRIFYTDGGFDSRNDRELQDTIQGVTEEEHITWKLRGGSVTLIGGNPDTVISAAVIQDTTFVRSATRDIIIEASIETVAAEVSPGVFEALADIVLIADSDGDGVGGVWIRGDGELISIRDVIVTGSDLFRTMAAEGDRDEPEQVVAAPGTDVDAVRIDEDGTVASNLQITAQGSVTIEHSDTVRMPGATDELQASLILVDGAVRSNTEGGVGGSDLSVFARDDIRFGIHGDLTAVGDGNVVLAAARSETGAAANGGGEILMADGTVVDAQTGTVSLTADGNLTLGSLQTTSGGNAVTLTSRSGGVTDAGNTDVDIVADVGTVTINAVTGVGHGNAIETTAAILDINNQTSGDVEIVETNDVTVANLTQATDGSVTITVGAGAASGNLEVDGDITAGGSGVVTLSGTNANDGLLLKADKQIVAAGGRVTLVFDNFDVEGGGATTNIEAVGATGVVEIHTLTDSARLRLGDAGANAEDETIRLSDAELNTITALGGLEIEVSNTDADSVDFVGAVTFVDAKVPQLHLKTAGGMVRTGDVNAVLTAGSLALSSADGNIGSGLAPVRVDTGSDTLAAQAANGSIFLTEVDGAVIGSVTVDGQTVTGLATLGSNGKISLTSETGSLTVGEAVIANGSGDVSLTAATGAMGLNANVASSTGSIAIAADSVGQNADIATGGAGGVSVSADNGSIVMADSTTTTSVSGPIAYEATEDVALSLLTSTNGDLVVTADNGAPGNGTGSITDNTLLEAANLVTSGTAVLSAAEGIGAPTAGDDIDTTLGGLSATNGTSGDIVIHETAGLIVTAAGVQTTGGSGNIHVDVAAGTLTLNGAVTADGSGDITLAGDSVAQNANVTVGGTGTVSVTADAGGITMANLAATTSVDGQITYGAAGDVGVSLLTSTSGHIVVTADSDTNDSGAITDTTNTEAANLVTTATATLTASSGIGATGEDDLDTTIGTLEATNRTIGDIVIQETNALIVSGTGVQTTGGDGNIHVDVQTGLLSVNGGVTADGSGDITLAGDSMAQNANVATGGTGTVSVTAGAGGITMANLTTTRSVDGQITYAATGDVGVSLLTSTSGHIAVTADSDTDGFGSISDTTALEAANLVTTATATLTASSGIGAAGDADMDSTIGTLEATNRTGGDIVVQETNELIVGGTGVAMTGGDGNIHVDVVTGTLTVNSSVTTDGAGNVTLSGGEVSQNDDVTTGGAGTVSVTADAGGITMLDGTTTTSENGQITYTATDSVGLSLLTTTGGDIVVTADSDLGNSGAITDTTLAETANLVTPGKVTLDAGSGIGGGGADNINTQATVLNVENSGDAAVDIDNTSLDDVTVEQMRTGFGAAGPASNNTIEFDQSGGDLSVTGTVSTGAVGVFGGDIRMTASAGFVVAGGAEISTQDVDPPAGALLIRGVTTKPTSVITIGDGNIVLIGGQPDTIIEGDTLSINQDITIEANRDIIVRAKLEGQNGAGIVLTADLDNGGDGGVLIEQEGYLLTESGDITLSGSDLYVTGGGVIDSIEIEPDSTPTNAQIQAGGNVTLERRDGPSPDTADIIINGVVASNGSLTVTAMHDVEFGAAGDLNSNGGTVTVTADIALGNQGGAVFMDDNALIDAGAGTIAVVADGHITLGGLQSTSTAADAVVLTSTSGGVVDGGDAHVDVVANAVNVNDRGTLVIRADKGVGHSASNPLDTQVASLDVVNATSGVIDISQTGDVSVVQLMQASPDRSIRLVAAGTIGVDGPVATSGTGAITLTAIGVDSDVAVNANVESGSGAIFITAGDEVTTDGGGSIINTTTDGTLRIDAANGVGAIAARILLDVAQVAAQLTGGTATGDIFLEQIDGGRDDLEIGTASGLSGITTGNDNDITVTTDVGTMTITQDVTAHGGGTVDLRAGVAAGEQAADVAVDGATVSSAMGAVQVIADRSITTNTSTGTATEFATTGSLRLSAEDAIGTGSSRIDTQVAIVSAEITGVGTDGDIFLHQVTGALEVGTALGLDGELALRGITTGHDNNIAVTSENGTITITQDVTADGAGTIDLRAGVGVDAAVDVAVDGATVSSTSGAIQVIADQSITTSTTTGATTEFATTGSLRLSAEDAVGTGSNRVDTQVAIVSAEITGTGTDGDIFLHQVTGALEVGTALGLDGELALRGITTGHDNNISVTSENGTITITQDVTADGAGTIDLRAGVGVDAAVDVAVDGATVSSTTGAIQVIADQSITTNTPVGTTTEFATTGSLRLSAENEIGDSSQPIETDVSFVAAEATGTTAGSGGDVILRQVDGERDDLEIGTAAGVDGVTDLVGISAAANAGGPKHIVVTTVNGTITVADNDDGILAEDGRIELTARNADGAASHIVVKAPVASPNGTVTLTAAGDIRTSDGGKATASMNVSSQLDPTLILKAAGNVAIEDEGVAPSLDPELNGGVITVGADGDITVANGGNIVSSHSSADLKDLNGDDRNDPTIKLQADGNVTIRDSIDKNNLATTEAEVKGSAIEISAGGILTIDSGGILQSATGHVTNATPRFDIGLADPDAFITVDQPNQEFDGRIGGLPGGTTSDEDPDKRKGSQFYFDDPDNVEYGSNFSITIHWDDLHPDVNGTVVNWPDGVPLAGVAADPVITYDNAITWDIPATRSKAKGVGEYDTTKQGPKTSNTDGQAVSIVRFTRTFTVDAVVQQLASIRRTADAKTQFVATITIRNDENIFLEDSSDRNINAGKEITDPDVEFISDLNQVQFQLLTEFGTFTPGGDPTEFVKPTVFIGVEERLVAAETRATPPRAAVRVEAVRTVQTEVAEEGRELYMVKVTADGSEVDREPLPIEALSDLAGLFELFRRRKLPNGTYRIYLEEEGSPRRQIREFRKSGDSFGDLIREPGRGANPKDTKEDGAAAPADQDQVNSATLEQIDLAFERFGKSTQTGPAGVHELANPDADGKIEGSQDPGAHAGLISATDRPPTADESPDASDQVIYRPHVAWNWTALVAFGLAAATRQQWDRDVDRALEESDGRSWRRATKWLSKLRNITPH